MWGALLAFGLVGSIVTFAVKSALDPAYQLRCLRRRLIRLGRLSPENLTLDQAEDGKVLARRLGKPGLEKKFDQAAVSLKKKRLPV